MQLKPLIWVLAATLPGMAQAVTCQNNIPPSNPDAIYTDNDDGTVTDTRTGLMWKKCLQGQSWSGVTCTGSAAVMNWAVALSTAEDATDAGYNDWRLPNIKELRSLVEECRTNPAINDTLFPSPTSSTVWSGSPYASHSNDAWYVGFSDGYSYYNNRDYGGHVRLVRAGQSFDPLPPPTAGVCGIAVETATATAPIANLCSAGTATQVTTANGQHSWQCKGENGGAAASCAAPGLPAASGGSGRMTLAVTAGAGCALESANMIAPPNGGPSGFSMPYGAMDFAVNGCTADRVTLQATFSGPVAGMTYKKYINGEWVDLPATLSGNTASFTIEDNGPFDADTTTVGRIADPSGPAVFAAGAGAKPVPTLSHAMLALMAGLMGALGLGRLRRRTGR
ncbi:MAG: DUF1566 domain-containing protein [Gammaproteobacteria bacterium]|nr:DUF1566 domain-containing protein [Gammaproteobacteria bacterium]